MSNTPAQEANRMLSIMPLSSGKYFLTSMAFVSLNPKDAYSVIQDTVTPNNYTPTQNVMNSSLYDISNHVSQNDKIKIQQYLKKPDVQNQLRNHTLLNTLSMTNLPKPYQNILIKIPHLTSSQILHRFNINNIVQQYNLPSMSIKEHNQYQSILNRGVQLGVNVSPIGLNYLRQSLKIYQQHPALLYAIRNKDTSELDEHHPESYSDVVASTKLSNLSQGKVFNGQKVQPSVSKIEQIRINQYVSHLPNKVIYTTDLSNLLNNISSVNKPYYTTSQKEHFLKHFSMMSLQEQISYKYLLSCSKQSYNNVQKIFKNQIDNPNIEKEYQHLKILNKNLTSQQNNNIKQFFTKTSHKNILQNGDLLNAIYQYNYGDSSINDIVQKALPNKKLSKKRQRFNMSNIIQQYKKLDFQSQKLMNVIVRSYAYNPQSFEREYIANMSGNPNMLSALSNSEKQNWNHIQNVARGKIENNGRVIQTGNVAQHKLDVMYLISKPENRNILRNGALNKLLNKDKSIQQLSSTRPQELHKIANSIKSPYSTYATLRTKHIFNRLSMTTTNKNHKFSYNTQHPQIQQNPK